MQRKRIWGGELFRGEQVWRREDSFRGAQKTQIRENTEALEKTLFMIHGFTKRWRELNQDGKMEPFWACRTGVGLTFLNSVTLGRTQEGERRANRVA